MKRKESIGKKKIVNTQILLCDIIENPQKHKNNDELKKSLKSQGALSKLKLDHNDDPSKSIPSCSINTFKAYANEYFDTGFKGINDLRINANIKINSQNEKKPKSKSTNVGLKYQLEKYKRENETLKATNINQLIIIDELRSRLKEMASSEESRTVRQQEYKSINHITNIKLRKLTTLNQDS